MLTIRPFRYADRDAILRLVSSMTADEDRVMGMSAQELAAQIRFATRGHMIPFRLFSMLTGTRWGILVAEIDGQIVGSGSYLGGRVIELANLLVHPAYRRQGIGQALLAARLAELSRQGCRLATSTVLAVNQPSINNLKKQGFRVFDLVDLYESRPPLPAPQSVLRPSDVVRPAQSGDKTAFVALEQALLSPTELQVSGSRRAAFFPSPLEHLARRLSRTQTQTWVLAREGNPIGFLTGTTEPAQPHVLLTRPYILDEHLPLLSVLLQEAANWATGIGKTVLRLGVPGLRPALVDLAVEGGWTKIESRVRLFKELV